MTIRKFLALSSFLLLPLSSFAQGDAVVMTVAGKPVTVSEFVYSYKKNNGDDVIDKKTVKEYAALFADYRLKVQAALDAKLDTMTSYNKEYRQYRDQQVMPTLVSDADMDVEARKVYQETVDRIGPDGLVNVSHILLFTGQNPTDSVERVKKAIVDSLYYELKKGADFADLAKRFSDDKQSAVEGGKVGLVSRGQTLPEFERVTFSLKDGEYSKPVLTEVGWHIIKVDGHQQMDPYEKVKNDIYNFLERRNIRQSLAKARLETVVAATGKDEQAIMDQRADSLAALDPEMKYLFQEYHDGLLLYEVCNREVWEKAANDEAGLKAFYEKNKSSYKWDEPRYKGIAYYTRDAKDIKAVQKALKGKAFDDWAEILRSTFNNDSILRIRVEKGIFKKGDNGLVDMKVFGEKNAKPRNYHDFPNTEVFGKLLKSPEEMSDVRSVVVGDYQELKEKEWLEGLRSKYPVVINEAVLDTIQP